MAKIAIVGSRRYPTKEPIERLVATLPDDSVLISGGAVGVDTWAEQAARARGLATEIKFADWEALGRKAGPIRNAEIVRVADQVIAFWDGKSRGTLNTVVQANVAGLPTRVFDIHGAELELSSVLVAARELGVADGIDASLGKPAQVIPSIDP